MTYKRGLTALAHATRRELFEQLVGQPRSVNELVAGTAISQPAVSQHLRVLRAAGLVEVRKQGAQRIYSVRPEGLRQLRDWIELCMEGSGPTATA